MPLTIDPNRLVCDHWFQNAELYPDKDAIVHWVVGEPPYRWSWKRLMGVACNCAQWLDSQGVHKGDVCALIIRHHRYFYPLYIGVCILGALPAVLAYPNTRLHPEKFREGLSGMSRRSGLDFIVTERDLKDAVAPLVSGQDSTIRNILYPLDWLERDHSESNVEVAAPAMTPDEACLLQHSSGTTGLQKPVVLSHRSVLEHVLRYGEALALKSEDSIASWLPLYHDMGLIAAFYLPLVCGIPVIQLDPFEWVTYPAALLKAISHEAATLCWLPNFAYNLMADRIREDDISGVRLDSVRMFINCSEPVRADSHERFFRRFVSYGLQRTSLSACYAMAETTFAATQTAPGKEAQNLAVDRITLSKNHIVPATNGQPVRICVSSGFPIRGCKIRIVDGQRGVLQSSKVGEIAIASASLFDGYRNYPEKSQEVLHDGWYYSGDIGFIHNGECFVIGRKKDIIIVAGNNIYPEDVEDAVSRVPAVIPGRVVTFGVEDESAGTEVLCVIAETETAGAAEEHAVKMAILKAGMDIDVTISRVFLVPPRWLIKSSSGKPARSANKARALSELKRS